MKNRRSYTKYIFAYDPYTLKLKQFKTKDIVPDNFVLGRPKHG